MCDSFGVLREVVPHLGTRRNDLLGLPHDPQ
jgi:hypothetical protein